MILNFFNTHQSVGFMAKVCVQYKYLEGTYRLTSSAGSIETGEGQTVVWKLAEWNVYYRFALNLFELSFPGGTRV